MMLSAYCTCMKLTGNVRYLGSPHKPKDAVRDCSRAYAEVAEMGQLLRNSVQRAASAQLAAYELLINIACVGELRHILQKGSNSDRSPYILAIFRTTSFCMLPLRVRPIFPVRAKPPCVMRRTVGSS